MMLKQFWVVEDAAKPFLDLLSEDCKDGSLY